MTGNWYSAYGLKIRSQLPLPAPHCAPGVADVEISFGTLDRERKPLPSSRSLLGATPDEVFCLFEDVGRFCVRQGREVIIDPAAGIHAELLAQWVQGSILSLILHQRGYLVLHSSSVAINGKAAAFIGECGWGKSTTAAALHARGHRLISDDIVAVRFDDGIPTVVPGFPQLKLMPEAVGYLGEDASALPTVAGDDEKRLRRTKERFVEGTSPLTHLFILGEAETCQITPLAPQAAMLELMRHAFVARLTEFLRLTNSAASHFSHCTQLVKKASVNALRRPKSFDRLPAMLDMIEQHVGEMVGAGHNG